MGSEKSGSFVLAILNRGVSLERRRALFLFKEFFFYSRIKNDAKDGEEWRNSAFVY